VFFEYDEIFFTYLPDELDYQLIQEGRELPQLPCPQYTTFFDQRTSFVVPMGVEGDLSASVAGEISS
jgi:hypothetical protein